MQFLGGWKRRQTVTGSEDPSIQFQVQTDLEDFNQLLESPRQGRFWPVLNMALQDLQDHCHTWPEQVRFSPNRSSIVSIPIQSLLILSSLSYKVGPLICGRNQGDLSSPALCCSYISNVQTRELFKGSSTMLLNFWLWHQNAVSSCYTSIRSSKTTLPTSSLGR